MRIGVLGFAFLVTGSIWHVIQNYMETRNDSVEWKYVDHALYQPPMFVALAGVLLLVCALAIWLGRFATRLFSK